MPGVELTLEANEQYWRNAALHKKRLVFKGVPERSTRLAMLKTGGRYWLSDDRR